MRAEDRARAAKAFLSNPLMAELFNAVKEAKAAELFATGLNDAAIRENCYLTVRSIEEMKGQLEVWARETERKGATHG